MDHYTEKPFGPPPPETEQRVAKMRGIRLLGHCAPERLEKWLLSIFARDLFGKEFRSPSGALYTMSWERVPVYPGSTDLLLGTIRLNLYVWPVDLLQPEKPEVAKRPKLLRAFHKPGKN